MKKLKINGAKLRSTISSMSLSIKSAAEDKGKIGEKTLHRMLNGEAINEVVVLKFFQNLGVRLSDYIIENEKLLSAEKEPENELKLTAKPNARIVLKRFELPESHYLPIDINWIFDFTNPDDEVSKILKSLNTALSNYCAFQKKDVESLSFEKSFSRLTSTNKIKNDILELEKKEIFTYSSVYEFWDAFEDIHDTGDGKYNMLYLNSKNKFLLYFSNNKITSSFFIASINVGVQPPFKLGKYSNIIVDGNYEYYNDKGEIDVIPF